MVWEDPKLIILDERNYKTAAGYCGHGDHDSGTCEGHGNMAGGYCTLLGGAPGAW